MTRKKSGFLTFICSLLPGAGEMYMGFMKMGVSLMGAFFLIIALASWLEIGPLVFVAFIAWFYSFFHVHNLASMPDEEFYALEDDYLFHFENVGKQAEEAQKKKKIIAAILILIGVILLWKSIFCALLFWFPDVFDVLNGMGRLLAKVIVGLIIIALGVYMIRGKKQSIYGEEGNQNIYEEGSNQNIYEEGSNQNIYEEDSNQNIYEEGSNQNIYEEGSNQNIYDEDSNQNIYDEGSNQNIYEEGSNQSIYKEEKNQNI